MRSIPLRCDTKTFEDFVSFTRIQLRSQDIDPVYPMLRHLIALKGLDEEQALWLVLVYVAWYNLASGVVVFGACPNGEFPPESLLRLPTGTERRGLRGGAPMAAHLDSLFSHMNAHGGSIGAWLRTGLGEETPGFRSLNGPSQYNAWNRLRQNLGTVWGNGRWATYKTAEILQKVRHWPVLPADLGNENSSGPRQGLGIFYGVVAGQTPEAIAELDAYGYDLQDRLKAEGVEVDLGELETVLCDFHSMTKGHYYPGHDIDDLLAKIKKQLHAQPGCEEAYATLMATRAAVFHPDFLEELNPQALPAAERNTLYRKTGVIYVPSTWLA